MQKKIYAIMVIAPFGIGIGLLVCGYSDYKLSKVADPTPQRISCQSLGDNGPGNNAHVILTDYFLHLPFATEEVRFLGSTWHVVPAIPRNSPEYDYVVNTALSGKPDSLRPPTTVRVLVQFMGDNSFSKMRAAAQKRELQGCVSNTFAPLKKNHREMLESEIPGINFDNCSLILYGRTPNSPPKIYAMLGGGLALILIFIRPSIRIISNDIKEAKEKHAN